MTVRSFSNILVFEDIFDYIPNDFADIPALANAVFRPTMKIVEEDCGTTLGRMETVSFDLEGRVELATGDVISENRIIQLLSRGIYQVATRHTSHCTSEHGLCKKCYEAANPHKGEVQVNQLVTMESTSIARIDTFRIEDPSKLTYDLTVPEEFYLYLHVFNRGNFLKAEEDYVVNGLEITFTDPLVQGSNVVIYYIQDDRRPFLYWLADTYSGSLLGLRSLPSPALPVRPLLLSEKIPEQRTVSVIEHARKSNRVPENMIPYIETVRHPLEKALTILAMESIFVSAKT